VTLQRKVQNMTLDDHAFIDKIILPGNAGGYFKK
jgi:hypothetical protein